MLRECALNQELPDGFLKPPQERLPENGANTEESRATGWALQGQGLLITTKPLDPAIPEAMNPDFLVTETCTFPFSLSQFN